MTQTRLRKSGSGKLLGNPEPTLFRIPDYDYSEIDECEDLCRLGGLKLFDWQSNVLTAWLARTPNNRWAASTCGLSVPRQNGKSLGTVEARASYGMVVLGEEVLYTAHLQKTATETFEDMESFFVDHSAMKKHLKTVREALGREQIILKNGARIKFLARTRSGGRGQHGSLLIFDEAQELDSNQQASFLFAISAATNPQTIYTGTPPDGDTTPGTVFAGIRKMALSGESARTAWHEWSVDEIPRDRTDRSLWALTNPSLGITIQEQTIESEVEQTDEVEFARERLGWWIDKKTANAIIKADDWNACLTNEPPTKQDGEKKALGIKFTADGAHVALSIAVKQGSRVYVECIDYADMSHGVSWLADWIVARRHELAMVLIDGRSNTGSLVAKLNEANYPHKGFSVMGVKDVVQASSMFANAVMEHALEHSAQPLLDESVTSATKRPIGTDGGWGFGNGSVDCAPAESAAFAYMAVMTTKRNPNRVLRIG